MVIDFRPFGAAMAKLSTGAKTIERDDGSEVELTTAIDTAYEIYLGLYQAILECSGAESYQRQFFGGFGVLINSVSGAVAFSSD